MGRKAFLILASVIALSFAAGCANLSKEMSGTDKLEAKDWLHAGDLAYKIKDYDNAAYFYNLVIAKYPDSYYGKKAKKNLNYVKVEKGLVGRTLSKTTEELEPLTIKPDY